MEHKSSREEGGLDDVILHHSNIGISIEHFYFLNFGEVSRRLKK